MSDVPKFDHKREVTYAQVGDGRFLMQDGHTFTNGYYNKQTKRFEPEPVYVPPGKRSFAELKDAAEKLIAMCDSLQVSINGLREDLMYNMGMMQDARESVKEPEKPSLKKK